jgi:CDP-diglyceride synthetase
VVVNLLLSLAYLFLIFLLLIYVVQILPLKIKLYRLVNRVRFRPSSLWLLLNDKTLFFTLFYVVFVSSAFGNLALIAVLTLDFFLRFTTSSYITNILLKTIGKMLLIGLFIFAILFIASLAQIDYNYRIYGCPSPAACTQENFSLLLQLQFNIFQSLPTISAWRVF